MRLFQHVLDPAWDNLHNPQALRCSFADQYQVLSACRSDQRSMGWEDQEISEDPFGIFTMALCKGAGYFGDYPADTNSDNKISLNEAYLYVIDWVNNYVEDWPPLEPPYDDIQDVQVYPDNSNFAIIEY